MKKDQKTDFLSARVRYIPINDIRPNPQQPRRRFDSESLQELAASIAAYGILQPLTVRQQGAVYELVAGERAAPEEKPPKTPGKRAGLIIGIAAAVLVLAYAGCCVAANALYSHTAFPNTSVLGMDMSGLSAQEAEQRWTEQGSALLDGMTIRLTRDGQEIGSTTLSDLGVTVLPVYVSKAAGCDVQDRGWGSDVTAFLRGGWRFIESWFRAVDVTPQLDVDEAKLTAACEQLSDTVGCTVTDVG